jgi:hypothetical protein
MLVVVVEMLLNDNDDCGLPPKLEAVAMVIMVDGAQLFCSCRCRAGSSVGMKSAMGNFLKNNTTGNELILVPTGEEEKHFFEEMLGEEFPLYQLGDPADYPKAVSATQALLFEK